MQPNQYATLINSLSPGQKDLITEGSRLLEQAKSETVGVYRDYSFVVFPFAKAYEGFLKEVFRDVQFISERDYYSDHFRLGKVLSPNLVRKLGDRSVFQKICNSHGCELGEEIWDTWKVGRNQVFHYFPHNLKSLSLPEAEQIIEKIMGTMEKVALTFGKNRPSPDRPQ